MASSAQSLGEMGVDLNNLVAEFKTGQEERTAKRDSRAQKPRGAKPMAKRLADARKRMEKIKRPAPHTTEKEATLKVTVGSDDTNGRHYNG